MTSRAIEPWVRFSPLYRHGGIPVPYSPNHTSQSVEGIWQGLKVFETADIDTSRFTISSMKSIKRTTRKHGRVLGHRKGVDGDDLLGYVEARRLIYLPSYRFVLTYRLGREVDALRDKAARGRLVLIDYETNAEIENTSRPLSHASLLKQFLIGAWP